MRAGNDCARVDIELEGTEARGGREVRRGNALGDATPQSRKHSNPFATGENGAEIVLYLRTAHVVQLVQRHVSPLRRAGGVLVAEEDSVAVW